MNQDLFTWRDLSDTAIARRIAAYIKHNRLQLNLTQKELAARAGIGLRTLIGIESGAINMNVLTLIQLLRALNLLSVFEGFEVKEQVSPLLLAKQELEKRKRAGRGKSFKKPESDW